MRYPLNLPYIIIIIQMCGIRWDLPKFEDILSINLGFHNRLYIFLAYIYIF